MRWFFRCFWLPFYRLWALRFVRSQRRFHQGRLRLTVPAGVFHPGIYFSTQVFIRFLKTVDFRNKKVLDVGTGSGVLALFAAQGGARAAALDINPKAVETARRNAEDNGLFLQLWHSDLFASVPPQTFDYFLINPPYYPQKPRNDVERAFFAGEQLEYFRHLFLQLPAYLSPAGRAWMILSEDCNLEKIQELARLNRLQFEPVFERVKWGERLFVFEIGR